MLVTNREEKEKERIRDGKLKTNINNKFPPHCWLGKDAREEMKGKSRKRPMVGCHTQIDSGDVGIIQVSSASTEDLELRDLKAGYGKAVEA